MRGKSAGNGVLAAIGLLSALLVLAPHGSLWGQDQELSEHAPRWLARGLLPAIAPRQ